MEKTLFNMPQVTMRKDAIIRALWWNQPFASLMLPPFDKDETRGRETKVRGLVLICACKKAYDNERLNEIAGNEQYKRICRTGIIEYIDDPENTGLLGHAVGIGNLFDCYPMKKEHENKCYVEYKPHLWVWKFANVQPIKPFEVKGKQGWAILTEEEKNKITLLTPQS